MKSDDKTPALGTPIRHDDGAASTADGQSLVSEEDLNVFDAIHHELGLVASESPRERTPEEQARLDALYARTLETMDKSPEEVRAVLEATRATAKK